MLGFSRWREWLDMAFPRGEDFARVLAEEARLVAEAASVLHDGLVAGALDAERADAAYHAVQDKARANLHALNRAFATQFDREDIFRGIDELGWVADHIDHAAREITVLSIAPDVAMGTLSQMLCEGCAQLADAFEKLGDDRTEALLLAQRAAGTHDRVRQAYEEALAALFVPGADALEVLKRREVYHHLADGGKRVRKAARVVMAMVVKDPT